MTGRDVHREWRDGMLAQGRVVAQERMAWETLSEQDRALDEKIAQRLSAPAPDALVGALESWRSSNDPSVVLLLKEIDAALSAPRPERTYSAEEVRELVEAVIAADDLGKDTEMDFRFAKAFQRAARMAEALRRYGERKAGEAGK